MPTKSLPTWWHSATSHLTSLRRRLRSGISQKRLFLALLPLVLFVFPRNTPLPAANSSWENSPFPLDILAVQSRRVRVLLPQDGRPFRVDNSSWGKPILIRFDGGSVEVRDLNDGTRLERADGYRIEAEKGRLLRLEGHTYRGVLEAFLDPRDSPTLVNELFLEDYLMGVVPLELGPVQFPVLSALAAQSIAARSYSYRHLGTWAHQGFDLFSDVRSQVYGGQAAEQELSSLAVLSTRGQSLIFAGKPILAYFSSTCGGITANFADAFQQQEVPYLRGGIDCPDQASPYRNWKAEFSIPEFQQKLGLPSTSLDLVKIHAFKSGRLDEVEVRTDGQELRIPGRETRTKLGLRSTWVTKLDRQDDVIQLEGHGFGHGVGLCQIGAVELARRGLSAEEILKLYYPGTSLEKVY